jgi:hypothetical protein
MTFAEIKNQPPMTGGLFSEYQWEKGSERPFPK